MIDIKNNRIGKGELALVYSAYWRNWSRLIYMYNGDYVEVDLQPVNSHKDINWEKSRNVNIRKHSTKPKKGDRRYLMVQKGSKIYNEVLLELIDHLTLREISYLLSYDFLPEIDWDLWEKYNNGGVFFKDCKKGAE